MEAYKSLPPELRKCVRDENMDDLANELEKVSLIEANVYVIQLLQAGLAVPVNEENGANGGKMGDKVEKKDSLNTGNGDHGDNIRKKNFDHMKNVEGDIDVVPAFFSGKNDSFGDIFDSHSEEIEFGSVKREYFK